jgi:hypothetical protein
MSPAISRFWGPARGGERLDKSKGGESPSVLVRTAALRGEVAGGCYGPVTRLIQPGLAGRVGRSRAADLLRAA